MQTVAQVESALGGKYVKQRKARKGMSDWILRKSTGIGGSKPQRKETK